MKNLKNLLSRETFILLSIPVLSSIFLRFGTKDFFDRFLAERWVNPEWFRIFYQYSSHFLLFFIIPVFFIKFIWKEDLSDFGFKTGDIKTGAKFVLLSLPLIATGMIISVLMPEFQPPFFRDVYPAIPAVKNSLSGFFLSLCFLILYYASFEFFYRGWLLFGLRKKLGDLFSILIQTIPSVMIHIHSPDAELFAAIPAEIFFGWLALKTGSIFYPFLIHLFVGITIELACILF